DTCRTTCDDSTEWHKKGDSTKDCAWVSVYPAMRCDVKGFDDSLASSKCLTAC
ncbi:hypothetical protein M885DRAFT_423569, partial [Pelagophyceae sp. CCMP2097]